MNLELDGALTCTYPKYKNGWRVKASPNGVLTDENGNDVEFLLLDVVEYNNDDYMVMIPLDDEEIEDDDEQDEVVILKVIREGDEETYSGVEDEDVLNAVFEIFQEQNAEEDED